MGDIFDTVGGYDDTENEEEEIHEGDYFNSVFALEDMPFLQKEDPDLEGMITYPSTGDLPISDRSARKILILTDQFSLDDGILWHFFLSLNLNMARGAFTTEAVMHSFNLEIRYSKICS